VFRQGHARSLSQESGAPEPQIFGTSYIRPRGMTHSNQIFVMIKLDERKDFKGWIRNGQKKLRHMCWRAICLR